MDEANELTSVANDIMTEYLEAHAISSTPLIYRRMALMTLVGGTLGRTVYVKDGDRIIYPNMYVMLVGDSGTKKSTAIRDAVEFMGMAGYSNFPNVRSSSDKFLDDLADRVYQREGSVQEMLDNPIGETKLVLALDEAKDFFCYGGSDIQSSMIRLYDCPDEYKTTSRTNSYKTVTEPTVSYIGGATPKSLAAIIPPESRSDGLLGRTFLVMETIRPEYVPQPFADKKKLVNAATRLGRYIAGAREVKLDEAALKFINEVGKLRVGPPDSRLDSYVERRRDHLLKFAIVTAVCRGSRVINLDVVKYAHTIMLYCECTMHFALGGYGLNKNGDKLTEIIRAMLYTNGVIYHDEMSTRLGTVVEKTEDLNILMAHLSHCGLVTAISKQSDRAYYTVSKRLPLFTTYQQFVNPKLLREFSVTENIILKGMSPLEIHNKSREARYGTKTTEAIFETATFQRGAEVANSNPDPVEPVLTIADRPSAALRSQLSSAGFGTDRRAPAHVDSGFDAGDSGWEEC